MQTSQIAGSIADAISRLAQLAEENQSITAADDSNFDRSRSDIEECLFRVAALLIDWFHQDDDVLERGDDTAQQLVEIRQQLSRDLDDMIVKLGASRAEAPIGTETRVNIRAIEHQFHRYQVASDMLRAPASTACKRRVDTRTYSSGPLQ